MTITNKKRNIIIIATIILAVAIATGFIVKVNHDKQVEQDRVIAVQAQIKAEEEKAAAEKAAAEKAAAEKAAAEKAAAEKEAAEKAATAKKAAEEKAAAEKVLKEALEKKKAEEEAASNKPSGGGIASKPSGGGTTSKPSDGGSSITSPGDKGDAGSGGWKDYPGNLSDELKKEYYEHWKEYIGKPEPGPGHEIRDKLDRLTADGFYTKVEWNSKMGVWEAQTYRGIWGLVDPLGSGTMGYMEFGLPQRQ